MQHSQGDVMTSSHRGAEKNVTLSPSTGSVTLSPSAKPVTLSLSKGDNNFPAVRGVQRLGLLGIFVGATRWVAQFLRTADILSACQQDAGGTIKKGGSRTAPTGNVTAALFAMTGLPSSLAPLKRGVARLRAGGLDQETPVRRWLTAPLSGGLRTPGQGIPALLPSPLAGEGGRRPGEGFFMRARHAAPLLLVLFLASPAFSATINVTANATDTLGGNGQCSIREAIKPENYSENFLLLPGFRYMLLTVRCMERQVLATLLQGEERDEQ